MRSHKFLDPYFWRAALASLTRISANLLAILLIFLQEQLIDRLLSDNPYLTVLYALCFVTVTACTVGMASNHLVERFVFKTHAERVEKYIYARSQLLSDIYKDGEFESFESTIALELQSHRDKPIITIATEVPLAAAAYIYISLLDSSLGLVALLCTLFSLILNQRLGRVGANLMQLDSRITDRFKNTLSRLARNFNVMRRNQLQARFARIYHDEHELFLGSKNSILKTNAQHSVVNATIYGVAKLSIIFTSIYLLWQGRLSPGEFMAALLLSAYLSSPIVNVADALRKLKMSHHILDKYRHAIQDPTHCSGSLAPKGNSLIFTAVTPFSLGNKEPTAIQVAFERGRAYLLTGENGCGKSTLLRQFFDSARHIGLKVCMIEQDCKYDAIVIQEVAQRIQELPSAHAMACRLGLGHIFSTDYSLSSLSGGEASRLFLSLALTSDFDILILDETIRTLDKENRAIALSAFDEFNGLLLCVGHNFSHEERQHFSQEATFHSSQIQLSTLS